MEIDAANTSEADISGPLDVRKLLGNARCTRCKDTSRPCYIDRNIQGNRHCLTCTSSEECQFRRVVVKEGPASAFTWEELTQVDTTVNADANSVVAATTTQTGTINAVQPNVSLGKRNYDAFVESNPAPSTWQLQPPQQYHPNLSTYSEPASQIRTKISDSPYAQRTGLLDFTSMPMSQFTTDNPIDIQNTGTWSTNPEMYDFGLPSAVWPHLPQSVALSERQNSVERVMNYSTKMLGGDSQYSLDETSGYQQSQFASVGNRRPATDTGSVTASLSHQTRDNVVRTYPASCPTCSEVLHTRSEYRKHIARHEKPFTCDHDDCPRHTDGFATRNDLDRHKAGVHNDGVLARREYRCSVPDCKDPNKTWTRKDNFKAHVKRMHPECDADAIVEQSATEVDVPQDNG